MKYTLNKLHLGFWFLGIMESTVFFLMTYSILSYLHSTIPNNFSEINYFIFVAALTIIILMQSFKWLVNSLFSMTNKSIEEK